MSERLPFDPARIRRPAPPATPAALGTLSVRQINELIRGALTAHIPATVHVLGQISNLSHPGSGHLYFTLKDAVSELRCVLWRSAAVRLKFTPEDGMEVIATGGIEVYAQRGTYQLVARQLEPRGVGALEVAFRQMRERLEREGLFDPARKRPLPRFPERIALVTSPSGAALRDILHVLRRRYAALQVLVFPVRVQGDGAAQEIAAAIRTLNAHAIALGGIDLLIVGRGGGSLEDLWAFNEEVVARAIFASQIPVVSAVGHEVDVSISDLVADLRAPTPTAAAELITPDRGELLKLLERQSSAACRAAAVTLRHGRQQLDHLAAREVLARPLVRLRQRVQMLDELQAQLTRALREGLRRRHERLTSLEMKLLRIGAGATFAQAARRLDERIARMGGVLARRTRIDERHLATLLSRLQTIGPGAHLQRLDEHIHQVERRLHRAVAQMLGQRRERLSARLTALRACDPRQVLRRGFSITRDARTRKLVRSVDEIRDRMRIVTELADGEFRATADDPRQPGLFDC